MAPRGKDTRRQTKMNAYADGRIHLKQSNQLSLPQQDDCSTRKDTNNCTTEPNITGATKRIEVAAESPLWDVYPFKPLKRVGNQYI